MSTERLEVGAGVVDDRTPIVAPKILNHVALSARETGPFQMNRSDETGAIIHNSLDESLRGITANGEWIVFVIKYLCIQLVCTFTEDDNAFDFR